MWSRSQEHSNPGLVTERFSDMRSVLGEWHAPLGASERFDVRALSSLTVLGSLWLVTLSAFHRRGQWGQG